jgi:methyl-accepting chemotaxis protein
VFWRRLSIQRLFLVTIILKIAASVAGWQFGSPWLLGFAVPLALMAVYILLGMYRGDDTVSDEKFADSCYYLGFIFTISSILVALLDIPAISAKIGDISVRFGAAMVSTVLGLIVRVYLVSFRPDFQDAVRQAESGLLDSVHVFRTHLDGAVERLREFQASVDEAARLSVAQVDIAVQNAAAEQARQFTAVFEAVAAEHRKVADEATAHLKAATHTLSNALYDYAQSLAAGTGKFEGKIEEFSEHLDARLRRVTLPEDYFASRLNPAVDRLGRSVAETGDEVAALVSEFRTQARKISAVLADLGEKTAATSASMDDVCAAVLDRADVLSRAKEQIAVFGALAETVAALKDTVNGSAASLQAMERTVRLIVEDARNIAASNREIGQLAQRQTELTAGVAQEITGVLPKLQEADARISGHLNEAVHAFDRSALRMGSALARQEAALARVSEQLETVATQLALVSKVQALGSLPARRTGAES